MALKKVTITGEFDDSDGPLDVPVDALMSAGLYDLDWEEEAL